MSLSFKKQSSRKYPPEKHLRKQWRRDAVGFSLVAVTEVGPG